MGNRLESVHQNGREGQTHLKEEITLAHLPQKRWLRVLESFVSDQEGDLNPAFETSIPDTQAKVR